MGERNKIRWHYDKGHCKKSPVIVKSVGPGLHVSPRCDTQTNFHENKHDIN